MGLVALVRLGELDKFVIERAGVMTRASWKLSYQDLLASVAEIWAIALLTLGQVLWAVPTRGRAALGLVPLGLALGYLSLMAGRLVIHGLRLPGDRFGDGPTVLVVGWLAVNAALFVVASVLPIPLARSAI